MTMTSCPHCGSRMRWRSWHRGRVYTSCTCGFEYSRAAMDPQYAAELRAEREYGERLEGRRGLRPHEDRAISALYEGAKG